MVWEKVYVVEVKVEVVWTDEVFLATLALLTRQCSTVNLVLLPCCHSMEAQSTSYIQGMFSLYP